MAKRKMPKKPVARKLPKKPKASASLAVWQKYEKRCKDVLAHNKERLDKYNRAVAKIHSDEKARQAIIKKYS